MCNSFVSLLRVLEIYEILLARKKMQYFVKPCRSFLHPAITLRGRGLLKEYSPETDLCLILIYAFKNWINIF